MQINSEYIPLQERFSSSGPWSSYSCRCF